MFVIVTGRDERTKILLGNAKIPANMVQITQPMEVTGYAFPEKYLDRAIRALKLEKKGLIWEATDKDKITLLHPKSLVSIPKISEVEKKKRFILVNTGIDESIRRRLAGKIILRRVKISLPRKMFGYALSEDDLPRARMILGLEGMEFRSFETNLDQTFLLMRVMVAATDEHVWHSSRGDRRNKFIEIAKDIIFPIVKKSILIQVPHGRSARPLSDGSFHILIWSSPQGTNENNVPERMWGIKVGCTDEGFVPSGLGIPIVDSDGYSAAELVGDNLYIHHDICHEGIDEELDIFFQICLETAAAIAENEKSPENKAALEKIIKQTQRERYVRLLMSKQKIFLEGNERKINNLSEGIQRCQNYTIDTIRKRNDYQMILDGLPEKCPDEDDKYGQEFDSLIQIPEVKKVHVAEDMIQVFTCPININHEGRMYDIGEFQIDIRISGIVRCFNLTRQVNNCHHPNIITDGQVELGSVLGHIARLIGEYQFKTVAQIIIRYLKAFDTGKEFCPIDSWPVVVTEVSIRA